MLSFHNPVLIHILKYQIRNEWCKRQKKQTKLLIHKNFFDLRKGLMGDGNAFAE